MTKCLANEGHQVNRKRVSRLMELLGIEAVYPKPKLSQPGEGHRIYPYLLRGTAVERVNQVWSTDITYKRHFAESTRRELTIRPPLPPHTNLSAQESKVLLALAAGRHSGQIAAELNLSAKTVGTYKRRVLNKLGLTSTAGLVHYVIGHNLA